MFLSPQILARSAPSARGGGGGGGTTASNFLARTSGLDATHITAYTDLLNGLDTDGLTSKLDVLHVYATQDSATALLNLVSTNFNGTAHGSPAFTADHGFRGTDASTTVYIDTNFNPTTATSPQFTQNSAHVSVWGLDDLINSTNPIVGAAGTITTHILPKFNDGKFYFVENSSATTDLITNTDSMAGHFIANRSAVSSSQAYRNGVQLFSGSAATSAAPSNFNFYSLGKNVSGTANGSVQQTAMISIGSSLTSGEAANFYSRLQTFFNTLRPFSTPADLTGLQGWWDASVTASLSLTGSTINTVADQSGVGNNLGVNGAGAKPTYNATGFNTSYPAMVFAAASSQSLLAPSFTMGTGATMTLWIVGTMTNNTQSNGRIVSYTKSGSNDFNDPGSWTYVRNGTNAITQFARNSIGINTTISLATPERHILTVDSSGRVITYINGVLGAGGTSSGNWVSAGSLCVGVGKIDLSYFDGAIAEFGIATGFADAIQVAQLDSYLKTKWGL